MKNGAVTIKKNLKNGYIMIFDFKNWLLIESSTHKFSCVMANLNNENLFINWSKKNIKKEDLCVEEGGIETEPHVTVLYGLHTNDYKEVEKLLKKVKSFEITLGKVSKFESQNYDVLKIEIKSESLFKINKLLKKLDFTSNFNTYVPHCTLSYVKKNSCDKLLRNKYFEGKKFKIKELVFSPSKGDKTKITLVNKI